MNISPEARFVTLCTREPDRVRSGVLATAARSVTDWAAVVDAAGRHRVSAYVERALAQEQVQIPDTARDELRASSLQALARVMRLDAALAGLLMELTARNVPVIVLKGPALARTLYGSAALRPYGDIDLTVGAEYEEAAVHALLDAGYDEDVYEAEAARRLHAGHVHEGAEFHRQFISRTDGTLVELHLDPLQLGLRPACEAGRWQRARPVPGLPGALMLSPEDQLVQLAVHAHKHGFDRLIWLKDIDLLLRTHGDSLDWALAEDVARREGVAASVWYTLRLAASMLGTPLAPYQLARFSPSAPVRLLYRSVWPVQGIRDLGGHMRRRAVQFHAAESVRGMLPNLVLMGRRRLRARALLSYLTRRWLTALGLGGMAAAPRGTATRTPPPHAGQTGGRRLR
jgi:hypothetical protein